ncbi:MAG TPA: efflux RND transporter periplasmic adaptor subunit [Chlorobaculum sp.]|uniref:Membrane fusion efflux protein, putative n=1 Tax=Chlorobaculum tepidum (strain ATCC 49652 / DSM 12025 / NBRC 103806 / TLS) TaxID=194439 RepID=Q8KCR5_CHLTE|nr:efflux RND transporter periplasmic adaptor subunit [Chlorobaculum tepidum]AAM72577.1 membrane fusion efflux protein, putative [Chlorobaculum tepidum TLS]HBU24565.1 efflux RND transporter periplasmic adaptor subunit [Chlorobaculum sp.]
MANTKRSGKLRNIFIIGGALFAIGVAALIWLNTREKAVEVTTEKVFRKEVVHTVTATGKIQPETEVAMSPDVSGEIIELPVVEGQEVKAGQLLFRIQPDIYVNQVKQSRAQLNLSKAQSMEAKARMLKAEDDFRKADILYKDKLISQTDWLSAKTNAETSRAAWKAARYSIDQNQSLLDQNEERLTKTVVRSPINGTIISLSSKPGERVVGTGQFPGTEVLKIANLDNMLLKVEVNENDIVNVQVGNPVTVTVDAFGDRTFKGEVSEIANSAKTQAANTQEEATNFEVKIKILNHQRLLKPGMSGTANIETQRVPNALVVPIQSVTMRTAGGKKAATPTDSTSNNKVVQLNQNHRLTDETEGVFVVEGDHVRFRKVKTGTTDNTHIIILEGVKEGEEVVSGSYGAISRELQDGSTVKLQKKR